MFIFVSFSGNAVMVWGLGTKNPLLRRMAAEKLLDGDVFKVEVADLTPDEGFWPETGLSFVADVGRPARPEHMPTRVEWRDRAKLPDVNKISGALVVCDRLKDLVEQFEPSVHQFLPIDYVNTKGEPIGRRWFFIPCVRIDSRDRRQTTMVLTKSYMWRAADELIYAGRQDEIPLGFDVTAEPKIVFSLNQIGNSHVWCDKFLFHGIWISDILATSMLAEDFTGINLTRWEQI